MKPIIQISALTKNYDKKQAVQGLDLEIRQGELFALVGPNGAGKTTTLKSIVGLLKPTSGTITIDGINALQNPMEVKRIMSYVPDVPYVYEKLTPWELLRFMGKLYLMDRPAIEKQGKELLAFFQLSHVQDAMIEQFSHGMRQKVILAASLIHNPKIFILDEPMVGLDPISIKNFKDLLQEKSRQGMTIIFSTHMLSMAEELGHRIGIINQGRLMALGTLEELKRKYESQENLEYMFMKLMNQPPA